jgi:hypothetical protein
MTLPRTPLLVGALLWLMSYGCTVDRSLGTLTETGGQDAQAGSENQDDSSKTGTGGSSASAGGSGATGGSDGSGGSGLGGPGASGGIGGSGGPAASCNVETIFASPLNNYYFRSTLGLPLVLVKPDSNLTIEWGGLTRDFMGHALDPLSGIDTANVMLWKLNEQALSARLNEDQLTQREAEIPIKFNTMHQVTSAELFDFLTVADEPLEQNQILPYLNVENYPPEENTYTAIVAVGDLASGGEARMIQAFKLDPASTNTTVTLRNESTTLVHTADLHSLTPTGVPAGVAAIDVDWTSMEATALGTEFLPAQITRAVIARYDETPAELEANFLDLEEDAEEMYEADVLVGTSISLDRFRSRTGQAFVGIDANGTWLLALFCGSCRNPAPWYLTILVPCAN